MIVTVDTGGTKTLVTSYSLKGGKLHSVRFETPQDQDVYFETLVQTLQTEFNHDITALSVAVPARFKGSVIYKCGNLPWHNFDLLGKLKTVFTCPILLNNDAKMAALGEVRALSVNDVRCLYITISTGIGTGFVVNGSLAEPLLTSEAGHMILKKGGVYCTWESFASGKAITKRYGKYASEIKSKRIWNRIADDIALGIEVLIPTFLPDYVIIGGSIGTHFDKYSQRLADLMQERLSAFVDQPKIIRAVHPEEAVTYGCYHYALESLSL